MPEINTDGGGRCRDSSFSFDSDNDKEEYLSKEFCSLYENTRSDRLYEMSKSQLIQEYLQLEASYDKLSNSLGKVTNQLDSRNGGNVLKRLADRVSELSAENLGEFFLLLRIILFRILIQFPLEMRIRIGKSQLQYHTRAAIQCLVCNSV